MMRYARQQHLRKASDFVKIRTTGQRRECGFFYGFIWRPDEAEVEAETVPALRRCAAIASRRVGGAVQRNRAKRRLRALFRLHQQRLPERCDLMLIARTAILTASFAELERRFIKAFHVS